MTDDAPSRLLFLLSLAPLTTGCPSDDAPAEDDGAASTTGDANTEGMTMSPSSNSTAPTPTTDPPPTSDPTLTTTSAGSTTDDPTTGDPTTGDPTTGDPTTGDPATGTTGEFGGTGEIDCTMEEPPPVGQISQGCIDYVALGVECYDDLPLECVPLYEAFCQYYLDYYVTNYGEACGAAADELYVCVGALECEALGGKDEPCPDELLAFEAACGF